MTEKPDVAGEALDRRYLLDYPSEAAQQLERLAPDEAARLLARHPIHVILPVWRYLVAQFAEQMLVELPPKVLRGLLTELEPAQAAHLLSRLASERCEQELARLDPHVAKELRTLMQYPPDSAGSLMDPRLLVFRRGMSVREAEAAIRAHKPRAMREFFLVDEEGRLEGRVEIQDLVVADHDAPLETFMRRVVAAVPDVSPREEVVEKLEQHKLANLPVVDFAGRLIGVIRQEGLVAALAEEASLDIQTMVGVSRDERALSTVPFAVRKRIGWLHINLLTAFLAAAVVGLFENTIAKFTALAVLLPVVAGQSGNAGAQALAVTMRGLALREIGGRHWFKVVWKEVNVGLFNGIAIALTTGAGVYVWSRSFGLALVIMSAMVLAMVAAGFSGALIPILLARFGQDPAQSSSIILTTVTDVVGFFAFLGIATLLASLL